MQFTNFAVVLASLATTALAATNSPFSWDSHYDTASLSTLQLACSDGANGLYTKGYRTLGQLPSFPNVAAVSTISVWNDADCGKCYRTTYSGTGKVVYVTGVDVAVGKFVMSKAALNKLTNGRAEQAGTVIGSWTEVAKSYCGL